MPSVGASADKTVAREAESLRRHIADAIAEQDRPTEARNAPGPTISKKPLQHFLVQRRWLRLSERHSNTGERSECVPDKEHTRYWKRLDALQAKDLVGISRDDVWLAKPVQTP